MRSAWSNDTSEVDASAVGTCSSLVSVSTPPAKRALKFRVAKAAKDAVLGKK
jgi:hypothetical protein